MDFSPLPPSLSIAMVEQIGTVKLEHFPLPDEPKLVSMEQGKLVT